LIKSFGWTPDYIRKRITGAQGWAYYFWAIQNEASMFSGGLELDKGYVAQEIERLKHERGIKCPIKTVA